MFDAIGNATTRRPWLVISAWLLAAVALSLVGAVKLYDVTTNDTSSFLPTSYESAKAVHFGETHFGAIEGATTVTGLVQRRDGSALTPADRRAMATAVAGFRDWRVDVDALERDGVKGLRLTGTFEKQMNRVRALEPEVLGVAGGGRYGLVAVQFRGNSADPATMSAFKQFRTKAESSLGRDGLRVGFTGGVASQTDLVDATKDQAALGQYLLFGAIIVLTLLFFRGVLSTILPLLLVALVAQAALGVVVLGALAFDYHLDSSVPELVHVVLIGIGIDYFLFMVFRFRERLRVGEERKEAARNTATTVAPVVASAALAIVVAFASLGLADFGQFRVLGPSVALAVAVMLVAGVTLVPALLAATGKKLFWPSRSWQVRHDHGPASRLGAFVAHRSARIALVGTGVLVALSLAAVGGKMSYDLGSLPESAKAQQVQEQIDRILPKGVTDRQEIYVSSPTPLTAAALEPMRERLARVDKVGQVSEPVFADGGRAAQIDVALTISSVTSQALDLAGEGGPLRTAAHEAAPPGATAMVGGNASVFANVGSSVNKDLRLIFPVAAGLILLILVLMLRSVVAPFYLLVAVGLEFAATLGTAILVFQHGMGHDGVVFTLPLVLFLFVVAIGTDYNILMSARLREELGNGGSQRDATARAVRAVAPAIAAAGLVLAASFGSLMLNKDLNTREIGFAMAMGILVASLLVSTLLVPAVTTVIGERAWWPRNRRPRAGVESPAGEVSFQDAA
jgi:RND superfamily putative drug exporter